MPRQARDAASRGENKIWPAIRRAGRAREGVLLQHDEADATDLESPLVVQRVAYLIDTVLLPTGILLRLAQCFQSHDAPSDRVCEPVQMCVGELEHLHDGPLEAGVGRDEVSHHLGHHAENVFGVAIR